MSRFWAALAIPILVGVPLWVETSWPVGIVALSAGALCLVAVPGASLSLATAGGTLALCSLALALRISTAPADVLLMAVFGSALLLLIEAAHLARRFEGAWVTPLLWRRTIAWWAGRASISLVIAIVVAALAPVVAVSLPPSWGAFVAGIGVVATFAAAVAFAWPAEDD
jgi:hypothetical protein